MKPTSLSVLEEDLMGDPRGGDLAAADNKCKPIRNRISSRPVVCSNDRLMENERQKC